MSHIRWMRARGSIVAHGFLNVELAAGFEDVRTIAQARGERFPICDLEEDELAPRCDDCQLAVGQV